MSIIQNFTELATTKTREKALRIIEAGITAVLPEQVMSVIEYDTDSKVIHIQDNQFDISEGRLFIIGAGKAVGKMAEALESIIPPNEIAAGRVICNSSDFKTSRIEVSEAGHPIPDERGLEGVQRIFELKDEFSISTNDLVVCLISGGGSALMSYPVENISLADLQELNLKLIKSGATIQEMNTIRKHVSKVKGGLLGKHFSPARLVSLIISDVIGNDLSSIASGLTVPDQTTFEDAYEVLKKYELVDKVPTKIHDHIKNNIGKPDCETPKYLENCENFIIGDVRTAVNEMAQTSKKLGFEPKIITSELSGDPSKLAHHLVVDILNRQYSGYDVLILGGETTPKVPEKTGKGGRNQLLAAELMVELDKLKSDWLVGCVATDGSDFIPGTAGAIVDIESLDRAKKNDLDIQSFINNFDTYTLFQKLGGSLVLTGDTGTNVGDLVLIMIE